MEIPHEKETSGHRVIKLPVLFFSLMFLVIYAKFGDEHAGHPPAGFERGRVLLLPRHGQTVCHIVQRRPSNVIKCRNVLLRHIFRQRISLSSVNFWPRSQMAKQAGLLFGSHGVRVYLGHSFAGYLGAVGGALLKLCLAGALKWNANAWAQSPGGFSIGGRL